MATKTPVFEFWKPQLDGDEGQWGVYLNENWERLDTILDLSTNYYRFFNGAILESTVMFVESDGVTATCEIKNPDLVSDISLVFNEEFATPSAPYIVGLTSGTDEVPVRNWVYFPESTQLLTVSLTGFPTTEQYVPVADIICQSAASSQTEGFYKVHAWTDHIAGTTGQGHLSHINQWIRNRPAAWVSGVVLTPSVAEGVSAALIDLSYTSGIIYQLHEHIFDVFDSSVANEDFFVLNDPDAAYTPISNLNSTDLDKDSVGGTLANKYYNLVVWGVVSEDLEDCQMYINLPTGSYNQVGSAIADPDLTTAYSLPVEFTGTAFLITRLVMRNQGGNIQIATGGVFDLRGSFPSSTGGGVIGGAGVTLFSQLLDTPNTYAGETGKAPLVNPGETGLEFAYVVKSDGTVELTADWDAGPFNITVETLNVSGNVGLGANVFNSDGDAGTPIVYAGSALGSAFGASMWLYPPTHGTRANDFVVYADGTALADRQIELDFSASLLNLFGNALVTLGAVGVGLTAPAVPVHIKDGDPTGTYNNQSSTLLTLEDDGTVSMQFRTSVTSTSIIYFGDTDSNFAGAIKYNHATDEFGFSIGGVDQFTLSASLADFKDNAIETTGALILPNLPTSDPLVAGQIWADGGILKVSVA